MILDSAGLDYENISQFIFKITYNSYTAEWQPKASVLKVDWLLWNEDIFFDVLLQIQS